MIYRTTCIYFGGLTLHPAQLLLVHSVYIISSLFTTFQMSFSSSFESSDQYNNIPTSSDSYTVVINGDPRASSPSSSSPPPTPNELQYSSSSNHKSYAHNSFSKGFTSASPNHSYILSAGPLWDPNGEQITSTSNPRWSSGWNHTTCCEFRACLSLPSSASLPVRFSAFCGCLDNGVLYALKHALCLPFTFGTLASVASEGDYSPACCGCGVCLGIVGGGCLLGHAVLPCAVKIRRRAAAKYGVGEGWGWSLANVCCCPFAAMIQTLMQVEEVEGGRVGW